MNQQENPLKKLMVIDRLEVGPVRIEKNRLVAPYRVLQNGEVETMDLIYRFEEDVFEPEDLDSQNLAEMIAAQVALNYGLFCKEILFHGSYDAADQSFFRRMAENTAREIYVIKIMHENPFLMGVARDFPLVKSDNYLQAILIFSGQMLPASSTWPVSDNKCAISSSGGKDSLLSFGLLQEMGYETYPVFINESGRHWYTALNAYRYLRDNHSETSRVWMNADRIFSWMLRHFPFIRQDFANVRSDEYPIRLWTVAVFLFGILPIMRKKGIGRLIIGDEYDTTRRLSFQGITHYDGLFDQSRYFDNELTRYFIRKKWNINQFSVVRPLSEMLIEKVLANRYPHLQRHQVSCHATHIVADRVYPCGSCEKCRRIVGMLTALDLDPVHCGYTPEQIERCLKEVANKSVHQESAGAQQLIFMLFKKGSIHLSEDEAKKLKENLEILKLRIDLERSPWEGMPRDLRMPLLTIYREYIEGSVQRNGRVWLDFDPLKDPGLQQPYIFEKTSKLDSQGIKRESSGSSELKNDYLLGELTWPDSQKRFKEVDIALLPVGAIEQHGPHLPLDTDAFDADYLARKVAEACSHPKPLVFPLISYGVSYHHDDFSGTISLSNETLSKLVYEIGMSAAKNGITKLLIINGHGGNAPALKFAAQMINRDAHIFTSVDTGETSDVDLAALCDTPNDVHAGEIETSTSLATRPHLVHMDRAKKFVPKFSSQYLDFSTKRSVEWFARTLRISTNGVLGDPTKATREKGEKMWEVMIRNLVELVEHLKSLTLNEIYEKKY
jgi:creatinine amidohydrolase/Fe(II)-dependent formamide hydrolase-like protein